MSSLEFAPHLTYVPQAQGGHTCGLAPGRGCDRGAQRKARGRPRPLPQGRQAARGAQRQGECQEISWRLSVLLLYTGLHENHTHARIRSRDPGE